MQSGHRSSNYDVHMVTIYFCFLGSLDSKFNTISVKKFANSKNTGEKNHSEE